MRAQPMGRLGGFDRRSWPVRVRDAVDALVRSSPSRFAILVFAGLILVFTVLFSLPIASADGQITPLYDALFTAVSVICVTGLATVDMATYWSGFGNTLVFIGVNIGGIGVLTLASILGLVISRRLGLRAKLLAASDTNPSRIHAGPVSERQAVRLGEVGGLLATVAISALVIEVSIALFMIPEHVRRGIRRVGIDLVQLLLLGDGVHEHGIQPQPGRPRPVRGGLLVPLAPHARGLPRQPRLPRDLRARPRLAAAAPLERAREAHARDDVDPLRRRRTGVPAPRVRQSEDLRLARRGRRGLPVVLHVGDDEIGRLRDHRHGRS